VRGNFISKNLPTELKFSRNLTKAAKEKLVMSEADPPMAENCPFRSGSRRGWRGEASKFIIPFC